MSAEDRSDRFKAKIIIGLPYGDKPVCWEAPVNPQPYLLPMLDKILAGEPDEFWGSAGQPASAEELLEYIVGDTRYTFCSATSMGQPLIRLFASEGITKRTYADHLIWGHKFSEQTL